MNKIIRETMLMAIRRVVADAERPAHTGAGRTLKPLLISGFVIC